MKKINLKQLKYLVTLITTHIENHPDDVGYWLVGLKIAYRTMIMCEIADADVERISTLDDMFEQLRNDWPRNHWDAPEKALYYK